MIYLEKNKLRINGAGLFIDPWGDPYKIEISKKDVKVYSDKMKEPAEVGL